MLGEDVVNSLISSLKDTSKISDGSHTFGELYHHRTVLFAVICNQNEEIAWKSLNHDDGTMLEGYFIAGVMTKDGDYTYHCEMKYWDLFQVKELQYAPPFDGHQPKDIDRLLSI